MNIEQAKSIRSSDNWEAVCKELDLWISCELYKAKTCSPDLLPAIQAKIRAFEEVKRLPTVVIESIE